MASTQAKHKFKVVLLGEGKVGKSSIVLRYVKNEFADVHSETQKASFLSRKLNIAGERIMLEVWDTAGQEKYHAVTNVYYRNSQGAVLVYDITDIDSFDRVKTWVKELRQVLGNDVVLVIAGNKIDLESSRAVNIADAESYAESVGATHYNTSAKLDKGIEQMFLQLTKGMLKSQITNSPTQSDDLKATNSRTNKTGGIVVTDTSPPKSDGGCKCH